MHKNFWTEYIYVCRYLISVVQTGGFVEGGTKLDSTIPLVMNKPHFLTNYDLRKSALCEDDVHKNPKLKISQLSPRFLY